MGEKGLSTEAQSAPSNPASATEQIAATAGAVGEATESKLIDRTVDAALDASLELISGVPAGWHPDPLNRFPQRYHDGAAWTAHVLDAGGDLRTDPY